MMSNQPGMTGMKRPAMPRRSSTEPTIILVTLTTIGSGLFMRSQCHTTEAMRYSPSRTSGSNLANSGVMAPNGVPAGTSTRTQSEIASPTPSRVPIRAEVNGK